MQAVRIQSTNSLTTHSLLHLPTYLPTYIQGNVTLSGKAQMYLYETGRSSGKSLGSYYFPSLILKNGTKVCM